MAEALTGEQILEAAQDVLRRFGPAKATVVDVARALGVSHGSVYRHFPSKAALREAVTRRWLDRAHASVTLALQLRAPAPVRLRQWLWCLFEAKRHKALDDPELFATFEVLVRETSGVVAEHIAKMVAEIEVILREGVAAGEFRPVDLPLTAQAVFDATARFHDPAYAAHWSSEGIEDAFNAVADLVLNGLAPR
ncbi:TetR family transcriptional regulator [Actinocrispum sp. NPDC049592]|uniref:TetR family transcriptional regulator n=1 Tax=Actinocrispum sp. NPDC049592 TaxID=3154835 RepID=UPI00341D0F5A